MVNDGKQIIKDIAYMTKLARLRYFGIGLEAMRIKRESYESQKKAANISKAINLLRKDVQSLKVKGEKGKSKAQDFLAGGSKRDASGNVISKQLKNLGNVGAMPRYGQQLAGRFERMQNRMRMVGGMIQQANKGSVDKKNPVADGLKSMLKMAVGASILGVIGKKLFDSSPLLQAMMKLFNTSVMLIFRPIGDFIGGFLRPLMLFFMKNIAIPFYKTAKGLGSVGEMYGKQALGFLLKPMETIHAAIVTGLSAVLPDWMLGGAGAVKAAQTYSGVADWQLEQMEKSNNEQIAEAAKTMRENTKTYGWFAKGINTMYTGQTGSGMGMSTGITSHSTAQIGYVDEELEIAKYRLGLSEKQQELFDEMTSYAEETLRDGVIIEEEFAELAKYADQAKVRGIDINKAFYSISNSLHTVSEELASRFRAIGLTMRSATGGLSQGGKRMMTISGQLTAASQGELSEIDQKAQDSFNKAMIAQTEPESRAEKFYNSLIEGGRSVADAERITANLFPNDYDPGGRYEGLSTKGIRATEEAKTRVGVYTGTDDYRKNYASDILSGKNPADRIPSNLNPDGSQKTWQDYYSSIGMAGGGVINEEIFGVGRSGQRYRFGENGSELVTPMNKSGGVGNTININIGNISKDADFSKLKPLIQRWILEANSRRGIV